MGLGRNIRTLYEDGSLDLLPTATFFGIVQEAIVLAASRQMQITFAYSNVHITVEHDSNPELIYRDYVRALCGNIDKNIGPHPTPVITGNEQASNTYVNAA